MAEKLLPRDVYRIDDETGEAEPVITEMDRPNGICFSPDETWLYVVDVGHIRVFDMIGPATRSTAGSSSTWHRADPTGSGPIALAICGPPRGHGGAGFDGVHCYAPDGTLIGQIHLPEMCANFCFGGVKKNRLFITATRSLYSVYVEAQGAQTP